MFASFELAAFCDVLKYTIFVVLAKGNNLVLFITRLTGNTEVVEEGKILAFHQPIRPEVFRYREDLVDVVCSEKSCDR